MSSSSDDDINITRGDDGTLIVGRWQGFGCDNCGNYHIELLDNDDNVFAVMVIEANDLVSLGATLLAFAAGQRAMDQFLGSSTIN